MSMFSSSACCEANSKEPLRVSETDTAQQGRTVAIHQPNFFPWLGYFDKLARSDVFVSLDHVQLPKTGSGTWINRVKLLIGGADRWVTAPIRRGHGLQTILEAEFDSSTPWRRKTLASLQGSYKKAPHYAEAMAVVEPLIANPDDRVAEYNLAATRGIAAALGLDTGKIVRSSELAHQGASNELLISLTRAVGGTAYVAGGGAGGYQQDELFAAAGVGLEYQGFSHPTYRQHGAPGEFVAGLSVIDALMNLGLSGTRELLAPGR
jgi:hypothetical protein